MNYLAHVYLARHDDDAMLGALLGDFVFGLSGPDAWPEPIRTEILLHRKIDRFTDTHPAVADVRERFPDGRRRYAGIALDIHFDHLLARDWAQWSDVDLDTFSDRFYRHLLANVDRLPDRLRGLAPLMARHDWFGSYRDRASVDRAVTRVATRLSRGGDKLVDCLPLLRRHETAVEDAFAEFFPDLIGYAAQVRAGAA